MGEMYILCFFVVFFFFKQKTAYEMRISDWSSDVCSSDLLDSNRKEGRGGYRFDARFWMLESTEPFGERELMRRHFRFDLSTKDSRQFAEVPAEEDRKSVV